MLLLCDTKLCDDTTLLNFNTENLDTGSTEQDGRFQQGISLKEKHYQEKCTPEMLNTYCCRFKRDLLDAKYTIYWIACR